MRNVLQLIGSFHLGGSERQAVQLSRLLSESGRFRVHVACLDRSGVLLEEIEGLGFESIPEFPLTSFYDANAVRQSFRFRSFLVERQIDIVHTHDFYTNVFGMPVAALARVPVRIASRRNTVGTSTQLQKRVERLAFRLSRAIVANAEAVKRQLVSEGVDERKVVTVYNGLDTARLVTDAEYSRDGALASIGIPALHADSVVTIVANFRSAVKDHATFLRAARRVRDAEPRAEFVLVGEGALIEPMRATAAELGLKECTHFVGVSPRVAELLAASSVCVLSSKAEGFSNSILEYMAASRPVVATDVGGAREVIVEGQTGYLVLAGDEAALADRIITLLRSPDRAREMGKRGRKTVESEFSCAAQLRRVEELYDRLLARTNPSTRRSIAGTEQEET